MSVTDQLPLEQDLSPVPRKTSGPSAGQRAFYGLLFASGLQLLTVLGVFIYTLGDEDLTARNIVMLQASGLGTWFILLAFMGKQYPLAASLIALLVFFAANIGLALMVPGTLMHGFILKIIIVIVLMRSVMSGLEAQTRD